MPVAEALVACEGEAELGFEGSDRRADAERLDEPAPLARRDRDDHDPAPVARREIAAEGAEEIVADPRAVGAGEQHLGDLAEMAEGGGGEVAERQADFGALSGRRAAPAPPRAARKRRKHRRAGPRWAARC